MLTLHSSQELVPFSIFPQESRKRLAQSEVGSQKKTKTVARTFEYFPKLDPNSLLGKALSPLPDDVITSTLGYIFNHIMAWKEEIKLNNKDLHLRNAETHLMVPVEISKCGSVLILLKKWASEVGKGNYKKAKQAVIINDPEYPTVVHATMKMTSPALKFLSDAEIRILNKIKQYQTSSKKIRGVLHFYFSTEYMQKTKKIPPESKGEIHYEELDEYKKPSTHYLKRALTTKYYNGGNLKEKLDALNEEEKVIIAKDILEGLAFLHSIRIFHSDLKLDNIFLEMEPATQKIIAAVIGDYGVSCDLADENDRRFKNGDDRSMAPELKAIHPRCGRIIDEQILACDIYSMGLILKDLFKLSANTKIQALINTMMDWDRKKRPNAQEVLRIFNASIENP